MVMLPTSSWFECRQSTILVHPLPPSAHSPSPLTSLRFLIPNIPPHVCIKAVKGPTNPSRQQDFNVGAPEVLNWASAITRKIFMTRLNAQVSIIGR
ncbi:hypothetical protein Leryth_011087 [Lithospermum erythrorhizon]|nr:hypothetical protein Leryth_011087 [Lithospermum erythrorhizon]